MTFLFRWKHQDGSIIEFSAKGWKSSDAEKSAWLVKTSELFSNSPVLAPAIRIWLQENCQLVEFIGPQDAVKPMRIPHDSGPELTQLAAFARAMNGGISPNFSSKTSSFRQTKRKARITQHTIKLACEDFFRSRGMPLQEHFNKWQRSQQTSAEDQIEGD
jgi:hypothetical protein